MRHSPFFRRLGCLFAVLSLAGVGLWVIVLGALLALVLGAVRLPPQFFQQGVPLVLGIAVLVLAFLALGGLGLRRLVMPLDDLLEAADRVAEGDYDVRV
jgi:hypothetical protein